MIALLNILNEIRIVAGQMSPYLLFGFIVAGILHVFVSPDWMRRHLGGRGLMPVVKSVLLGVPLPLCSCGVIAVTASIRKQGAGRGAATGFLLATPQTGVDSILATWGMMGPVLGLFRPVIALITGIVGGCIAALLDDEHPSDVGSVSPCADGCDSTEQRPERSLREIFRYGLVVLPADIAKPLLVGVMLAGLIGALAPRDLLAPYLNGGILAMVMMTMIGIPLYVCATASIPVALSFMHLGASPGAALAFLIAGPATNAATIATVWKVLGRRTAFVYLGTVFLGAIASGWTYDWMVDAAPWLEMGGHGHVHAESGNSVMNMVWAALLLLVVFNSMYGKAALGYWRRMRPAVSGMSGANARITLRVSGMTCQHCADALSRALGEIAGVRHVDINLKEGTAVIVGQQVDMAELMSKVVQSGYTPEALS